MSDRINFVFREVSADNGVLDSIFLDVRNHLYDFVRKYDCFSLSEVSYEKLHRYFSGSIEFDKSACNLSEKEVHLLIEDFSYKLVFMVAGKYDAVLNVGWSDRKNKIDLLGSIDGVGPLVDLFDIVDTDNIEISIKSESKRLFMVRELLMGACIYAFKNNMMKYRYMGIYEQSGKLKYKELLTCICVEDEHIKDIFSKFMYIDKNTGNIDLEKFFMAIKEHRLQNPFLSMMSDKLQGYADKNVPISVNMYSENLIPENVGLAKKLWDKNIKIIEIVESSPIIPEVVSNFKEMCVKNGMDFKFYIDDFGTGYANPLLLTHVKDIIDGIKIDKRVLNMLIRENGKGLITDLVKWSQDMGYEVVFEGVDSRRKLNWLNSNFKEGIAFQGFLFHERQDSGGVK